MSLKKQIIFILRKTNLFYQADHIRYLFHKSQTKKERESFKKENPTFKLPPDYFLYETHRLNYQSYFSSGKSSAEMLNGVITKYFGEQSISILDWGCGPGRVIRHFPPLRPNSSFYGTDYNEKYINWCAENTKDVSFKSNQLEPPLEFENETFNVVYGLSIFTHLSKNVSVLWFNELNRIVKPGGILIITFHGDSFLEKLSESEKEYLEKEGFYERDSSKEGHRSYSSYQSKDFVASLLLKNNEILEFKAGDSNNGKPGQDVYVIRKN